MRYARFIVAEDYNHSCCFEASVIDTRDGSTIVCSCTTRDTAEKIAALLNMSAQFANA